MTTYNNFFTTTLVSYSASKGYKRWPGVLENMELLKRDVREITQPDKTQYAATMTTVVKGTNCTAISKQEWIVTDCTKETKLNDNYNNELHLKLSEKALFKEAG